MGIAAIHHGDLAPRSARSAGTAGSPAPASRPLPAEAPANSAPVMDPEQAQALAREVQDALDRVAPASHEVAFRRDEATNSFVIEVRDLDGSTVRQYPPEKLLNLRRRLDELSGMVIDQVT